MTKTYTIFRILCLGIFTTLVLTACGQMEDINRSVQSTEREAERAIASISPDNSGARSLKIDNRPWYGVQVFKDETPQNNLPPELKSDGGLVLTFAGPQTFDSTIKLIESVSGIPVIVTKTIYEANLGALMQRDFLPANGQEVSGGRVIWSGALDNLLNQVANNYGVEWSYDGSRITFVSEVTKTFMLHALAGNLTITDNASSGGNTSSNVPELSVDGSATLEIWGEITQAIERMVGDFGQASFSPSTGSITITARPDVLKRVETYLDQQNEQRLRRIAISVKVLDVETSDTLSLGTDVSTLIKGALGDGIALNSTGNSADGLSLSLTKSPSFNSGDFETRLEASQGISRVGIAHSGSIVTLSDQPAPLQVGRQIAYLERVTASGGDTSSVSLEPGTVDVGLFMTVLPRIVAKNQILMRLSIAITDTDPNFRSFGSGDVQIELPEIATTGFLQNTVVQDGETLVLAGFERTENSYEDSGAPSFLLGKTRDLRKGRNLTVLVINAQILPTDPITVIGQ